MLSKWKKKVSQLAWGLKLNVKFTIIIVTFVLVPIVVFSMIFFYNIELNAINESKKAMEYSLRKSYDDILNNLDSINMSTQFFLSDKELEEYLVKIKRNEEISYEEMMDFYKVNIASMERMVNNNPYLYQIRVYVDNNNIDEMMPILYTYKRMERLRWSEDKELKGWKFDYVDTTFEMYQKNQSVLSLVTPMMEYENGQIGILEVAMRMDTMFPVIYEDNRGLLACFLDDKGNIYCRDEIREEILPFVEEVQEMAQISTEGHVSYEKLQNDSIILGVQYVNKMNGTLI